jgi:predicted lipoprotein
VGEARPPDDRDAAKDITRELARIASELASIKGDAYTWLTDPNYRALVHRIEAAHASVEAAAVEARRRVRLNEERKR